jgi:hypothetical protein
MTPLQAVTLSPRSPVTGHRIQVCGAQPIETRRLVLAAGLLGPVVAWRELAGRWQARRTS